MKALFFVVGNLLTRSDLKAIIQRAHREGHHVGNHTFSHKDLKTLSENDIRSELRRTQDLIGECGHECKFFRPPYGASNATVSRVLQEEGYMTTMWNVDTLDWKHKKDGAWVDHGMEQIRAREDSIVLMHDIHQSTVDHVDALIEKIKQIENVAFRLYA